MWKTKGRSKNVLTETLFAFFFCELHLPYNYHPCFHYSEPPSFVFLYRQIFLQVHIGFFIRTPRNLQGANSGSVLTYMICLRNSRSFFLELLDGYFQLTNTKQEDSFILHTKEPILFFFNIPVTYINPMEMHQGGGESK